MKTEAEVRYAEWLVDEAEAEARARSGDYIPAEGCEHKWRLRMVQYGPSERSKIPVPHCFRCGIGMTEEQMDEYYVPANRLYAKDEDEPDGAVSFSPVSGAWTREQWIEERPFSRHAISLSQARRMDQSRRRKVIKAALKMASWSDEKYADYQELMGLE